MGWSENSSRHIVVAGIATDQPHQLGRLVRRARQRFRRDVACDHELKFHGGSPALRRHLLSALCETDAILVWTGIDKQRCREPPFAAREEILTELFARACAEMSAVAGHGCVEIMVDKRISRDKRRREFDAALQKAVEYRHPRYFPPEVRVRHVESFNSYGLQIADHVAGAVFREVESGDRSYSSLVKSRVKHGRLA
jgi:hypothetical protein